MFIVKIILVLAFSGFAFWMLNTYVPLTSKVKAIINPILVGILCLWLFHALGLIESIKQLFVR